VRCGVGVREEVGLDAIIGVAVREGSWLAIGVISVPMSLIETDLTAGAGSSTIEALCAGLSKSGSARPENRNTLMIIYSKNICEVLSASS
jgi:hypothetical protein